MLNPWLATLLSIGLSALCTVLALYWRRGWWVLFIAGIAILLFVKFSAWNVPRAWRGYLYSVAVPWLVFPLLQFKLTALTRKGVVVTAGLVTFHEGWMEFLGPALARSELADLKTTINNDGVCMQGTDYTCGPAAAVTILRRLGLPAEESDLALRASSSDHTGTEAGDLAAAIQERFGADGVRTEEGDSETLDELRKTLPALAVIKWDARTDHWVAVLEVNDQQVRCGDPVRGLRTVSRAEFEQEWRHRTLRVWRVKSL